MWKVASIPSLGLLVRSLAHLEGNGHFVLEANVSNDLPAARRARRHSTGHVPQDQLVELLPESVESPNIRSER
jgi:hypothetical protein